jgi:putative inorganic carbon (hco3(-)) transporter
VILWICTIFVVCIITSMIFYKPYLGVVAVIMSIPFEGVIDFGYISVYPLETILAITVLVCIYKGIVGGCNYFGNVKLVYCCVPFVLCIMLSAVKSTELSLTVKEIVRWLELFLIYYLTINLINDDKKMRIILYSMFLTVAMVSVLGIINYLSMGHRAVSLFGNSNPLAGYVNLIIPVLFGMLMSGVFLWEKITLGAFTGLSIVTWFLSFSRSGWLSLIITMVLFFFINKAKRRVVFISLIIFSIFAVIVFFTNIKDDLLNRSTLEGIQLSTESRIKCYPLGFNMVKDDLIFGVGTGNYCSLIKSFTENDTSIYMSKAKQQRLKKLVVKSHLHSLYLQIFVETGFMGLFAFIFWLVCNVKYLVSSLRTLENTRNYSLLVGLVGGVIVYLFNNLVDVLVVHGIHLQFGIILGLAVVLTQLRESDACSKTV